MKKVFISRKIGDILNVLVCWSDQVSAKVPRRGTHHVPHPDAATARELTQGQLQEIQWSTHLQNNLIYRKVQSTVHKVRESLIDPTYQHEDADVGDEESAATVLVGSEGEPPHVSQTDRHGDAGQKELHWAAAKCDTTPPSPPRPPVPLLALRLVVLLLLPAGVLHKAVEAEEGHLPLSRPHRPAAVLHPGRVLDDPLAGPGHDAVAAGVDDGSGQALGRPGPALHHVAVGHLRHSAAQPRTALSPTALPCLPGSCSGADRVRGRPAGLGSAGSSAALEVLGSISPVSRSACRDAEAGPGQN